jgi:hypothetical protein
MPQTLEDRVVDLERQVSELHSQLAEGKSRVKNPWGTFGIFKDDPDFEAAVRQGQEWRAAQTWEKEIANT